MSGIGEIFANKYKVVPGQASPEDILVDATNYPASGSFIDVSGCERFHVLVQLGALNAGSTITLEVRQAEAINGTPDVIDATYCKFTAANDADDQLIMFTVEVAKLATDHHFVTLQVEGTVASNNYAAIFFLLPLTSQPVTQDTVKCPAANQLAFVG
jgi:hypothetical protein